MDYIESILVPHERIGAIIGEEGKTKRLIEQRSGLKIEINSENGEVLIKRTDENAPIALKTMDVIKAIARGFTPRVALELLSDDVYLKVVNLEALVRNEKSISRQKARIIGTKGKTRRILEEYTGARISVYGKTVSMIGSAEAIELAGEAVAKIASGTPQGDVYKYIQKKQKGWI